MSEVVVPIRKGIEPSPAPGTINPDVVKEIQELLDKANAGDISGIAYVTLHPGDHTVYYNIGRLTRGVIGALVLLQHHLAKSDSEDE